MDIREKLEEIPEPRMERCRKHNLVDILLLCIIAMICGETDVESIAFFGECNKQWLKDYLKLPNGIPSADTILRVLSRIDSKRFEDCLRSWMSGYFRDRVQAGSVVAIDGKTVRGSGNSEKKAIHLVSAWSDELHLVLGQVQTEEKSNEITAIPELLVALDLAGCIVTIDAMGCQKEIARTIVEKKSDYVLAVKGNHPTLSTEVKDYFETMPETTAHYTELTKDHGRIERRDAYLCTDISWFADKPKWEGLTAFGCIRSSRTIGNETAHETRYYMTTLTNVDQFAHAVRSHWGIENGLHWTLDVSFKEDYARNRKDHAPANMAILRKITLNLIKMEPTERFYNKKLSVHRKQLYAAYHPEYRVKILLNL